MIALSFFLALMPSLPRSRGPAVRGGLQPRLRRRHAFLEGSDLVRVLEREADVVEAFEQAHAVGGRNVERDIGAAGPLMRWVSRSTVNGAAPFAATTRFSNASASCGASTIGSKPFCRQFSR